VLARHTTSRLSPTIYLIWRFACSAP
jgi:hypothetical protein